MGRPARAGFFLVAIALAGALLFALLHTEATTTAAGGAAATEQPEASAHPSAHDSGRSRSGAGRPAAESGAPTSPTPSAGSAPSTPSADEDGLGHRLRKVWDGLFGPPEEPSPVPEAARRPVAAGGAGVQAADGADAGAPERPVRLISDANIRGRVVSLASGDAVAGAVVHVAQGDLLSTLVGEAARTDASGEFLIRRVPVGRFSLRVTADGYLRRVLSGLQAGSTEFLLVEMSPADPTVSLEFGGLGLNLAREGDDLVVTRVLDGGARKAGVQRGDRILAVDGLPVRQLDMAEALEELRGPLGSTVRLRIARGDGQLELEVQRGLVRVLGR